MRIRLIRKLAAQLNGVDVSSVAIGDCFDCPLRDAAVLIAEGWAEPAGGHPDQTDAGAKPDGAPGRLTD